MTASARTDAPVGLPVELRRDLRAASTGWGHRTLAFWLEIDPEALWGILGGWRRPTVRQAMRIAHCLGLGEDAAARLLEEATDA